jgi:putative hydrolase of HD superfamily
MGEISRTVQFLFEVGLLKDTPRSGWLTIGIKDPESVAEHSFRTAIVGLILAKMENADEEKVLKMCLLHDIEETRLGDLHTVNKAYLKEKRKAYPDILGKLFCEGEMKGLLREFCEGRTRESTIAKDADRLEMVLQAKEYCDLGKRYAEDWIKSGMAELKTKSARKLAKQSLKTDSKEWLFKIK